MPPALLKPKKACGSSTCARGGLIEEVALMDALNSGHVAAAALDVYEDEPPAADCPLRSTPNLIMTPHLGASTAEAQESVGIEIAETIKDTLIDGTIRNAVNTSSLDKKTIEQLGPYITLGEKLGVFLSQTRPNRCDNLTINYSGKISEGDTTPITRAILKGFLNMLGDEVNIVNAPSKAEALGMKVTETRNSATTDFSEQIEITACAGEESAAVIGTFFGSQPKIVKINDRHLEARPEGVLLLLENKDRPGIVGHLGSILADHSVNIASMSLSRASEGGRALTVLNLDTAPDEKLLTTITEDEGIYSAKVIEL